jgi:hypothetical protein
MTSPDTAGLCERLRAVDHDAMFDYPTSTGHLITQAADTLERQAAEIERLREALRFYADEYEFPFPSDGPWGVNSDDFGKIARAALTGEGHD